MNSSKSGDICEELIHSSPLCRAPVVLIINTETTTMFLNDAHDD
jgi:hypothetical protein